MMLQRLDHIAFRVAPGQRDVVSKFLCDVFGYHIQGEPFKIFFDDEQKDFALSVALEPPTNHLGSKMAVPEARTLIRQWFTSFHSVQTMDKLVEYWRPPEFFISEGTPPPARIWKDLFTFTKPKGNIVYEWVKSRGGVGGVHHMAYEVDDVEKTMKEWTDKGYAQFSTDKPVTCPGITQVFTKPNPSGVIFELIKREGNVGFCASNVKKLMIATKGD
jgi:4-hydroxyphenylpyruvate dioxygenase-like putative hemolysin